MRHGEDERISPGVTCRRSGPHIMRADQAAGWFTAVRHERLLRRKEALERAARSSIGETNNSFNSAEIHAAVEDVLIVRRRRFTEQYRRRVEGNAFFRI